MLARLLATADSALSWAASPVLLTHNAELIGRLSSTAADHAVTRRGQILGGFHHLYLRPEQAIQAHGGYQLLDRRDVAGLPVPRGQDHGVTGLCPSEEHTSELQSREQHVCRHLHEKKDPRQRPQS